MHNFTPFRRDEEVAAIGRGLMTRTLPKTEWTHAAHFASALWLIACCPEIDVCRQMPGMIRAYNEATGGANTDSSGYHETITQASLRAARAFLADRTRQPLYAVCNELMTSALGRPDWPLTYWSRALLLSVEARRAWVEPDLQPLPW
jgi:hypothetical protein